MSTENLYMKIINIINDTQFTLAVHEKCKIRLKRIYNETDANEFYEAFQRYLKVVFAAPLKPASPSVQRSIKFCVAFCIEVSSTSLHNDSFEESIFFVKIIDFLVMACGLDADNFRYRGCQILKLLFEKLVGVAISDELCNKVQDVMLERITNDIPIIRAEAANVLIHLQNPTDPHDPVIKGYIDRMMHDSSSTIRRCCVEHVAPRRDVIPILLLKIRDIDANVRLAAFKKAATYPKHFKIFEKQLIIKSGRVDDSEEIKKFIENVLVCKWFEIYDENYLVLLKSLKLDSCEEDIKDSMNVIEYVLKSLFGVKPLNELIDVLQLDNKKIPRNLFNWEILVYWCNLVKYLELNRDQWDMLDEIVPDVVDLCPNIIKYMEDTTVDHNSDNNTFYVIIHQLFLFLGYCNLSDVSSRNILQKLILKILKEYSLDFYVISTIVRCLEKCTTISECNSLICELTSDIIYPFEVDNSEKFEFLKKRNMQNLNHLKQELEKAVIDKDFNKASELQSEITNVTENIEKLQNSVNTNVEIDIKDVDANILKKGLNILVAHLESPKIVSLLPSLKILKKELIIKLLIHHDKSIMALAMKCYALLAFVDQQTAEESIHIFALPISTYEDGMEINEELLNVPICGVVDLLLIFGSELIASPYATDLTDSFNEINLSVFMGGTSLTDVIQGLVNLMNSENSEISYLAIHGLCKLITYNIIRSSSLLTSLLIKWYTLDKDVITDKDKTTLKCQQTIGIFLQNLPRVKHASEQIEEAIIPTLKIILEAPAKSLLNDIDIDNVSKFLISLSASFENGYFIHVNLAYQLLREIKGDNNYKKNITYAKMLLLLNLTTITQNAINELIKMCECLDKEICDKKVKTCIQKFSAILNQIRIK